MEKISFAAKPARAPNKIKFYHLSCERGELPLAGETEAYFIPFRTATVFPFSFPFGRKVNLRSAITLTFRPILGEQESRLSLVPQVAEQRANLTRGAAWFVSREEISESEERLGNKSIFLPAPAAFASEIDGDGVIVWREGDVSCAVWFKEYTPQLYRYASGGAEELAQWMRSYVSSTGGEIPAENVRIFCAEDVSREELRRAAAATFAAAPGLARLDLSNRGASMAEQYEAFLNTAFQAVKIASAAGLVFLILSLFILVQNKYMAESFAAAPSEVYRLTTGEVSRSPLADITKRLRLLTGGGVQLTLEGTLANFAAAWKTLPAGTDIKVDAIRYGRERTEIEGQASKTDHIQLLRDALAKNGFTVKLGDVQQIPGGGMRFTLNLAEGGR